MQGLDIPETALNDKDEIDLSEASLAWYIYTYHMRAGDLASGDYISLENKGISGGNASIASYALAAGIGIQFNCYADLDSWEDGYSEYQRYTSYYTMESSDIIWSLSSGSESIIKQWIMESGAVTGCYYSGDRYYDNGSSSAYYQNSHTEDEADHAILIVGWDDNYAKENFKSNTGQQPSEDGAWLVRNSWGDDDVYEGYFWMSYEELSLCELARFQMTEQSGSGDTTRYQYDGGVAYSGIQVISSANIFTAQEDSTLTSVMFPMTSLNESTVQYTISIYQLEDDPESPVDGTCISTSNGTVQYGGYKSITLDTPVSVEKGEQFSVVLSLSYPGSRNTLPYTAVESNLSTTVDMYCYLLEGQSYVCANNGEWIDMYDLRSYTNSNGVRVYSDLGNVAIKVLATPDDQTTNRTQLESALAYGEGETYAAEYAAALSVWEDETAEQWEIDFAAENLLAGLEKAGLICYPMYEYAAYDYVLGDVDMDEEITINDAGLALQCYTYGAVNRLTGLLPAQVAAADMDGDGKPGLMDAYEILVIYAERAVGNSS